MAEEAPAPPATTPSKAAGKAKKKRQVVKRANRDGPSLSKQIVDVISESKDRKGMSVAAMKKLLAAKGVDVPKVNRRINIALVNLVAKGILTQTTGIGASGSFKLAKKEPVAKKPRKTMLPKKKPAAKKSTTTTTTSAVAGRKSTAGAKKRRISGKSETKTKKPGKKASAKKTSKSASSPRKATTSRAKSNTKTKKETPKKGKRPAAKKPAPKKAGKKAPGKKSKK